MQDLFGSAARPATQHNLFFALVPDDAMRRQMARTVEHLRSTHAPHGRWLKPERYHLTLHFLGTFSDLPAERIASACKAAEAVGVPAFDLMLDRAGHFSQGIGWLGCAQTGAPLQRLWEELRKALAHARIGVQGHAAFKPHVTVLRDARNAWAEQPIEPVTWSVREFMLIDSVLGSHSEYRTLGRWSLPE